MYIMFGKLYTDARNVARIEIYDYVIETSPLAHSSPGGLHGSALSDNFKMEATCAPMTDYNTFASALIHEVVSVECIPLCSNVSLTVL